MIKSISDWFIALSQREKILVGFLAFLVAATIGYYGLFHPLSSALEDSENRFALASERHARVESKVALLKAPRSETMPSNMGSGNGSLDALVSQSTGEAGFAVGRLDPQSDGSINLVIDSAKPTALFGWLSRMEAAGILTDSLNASPSKNGTITATIAMRRISTK